MASTSFIQELFRERELRPFVSNQEQLKIAKQSLIYKKKTNTNVHSILFCKSFSKANCQFTTQAQKNILQEQKIKYFEYVRKTFKEKIPEDFESENKLKKALRIKIAQKKDIEANTNPQDKFKRSRAPVENSKEKKANGGIENKKKRVKEEESKKKKLSVDEQGSKEIFEEERFESEIDLINDQIEDSDQNGQDQF